MISGKLSKNYFAFSFGIASVLFLSGCQQKTHEYNPDAVAANKAFAAQIAKASADQAEKDHPLSHGVLTLASPASSVTVIPTSTKTAS